MRPRLQPLPTTTARLPFWGLSMLVRSRAVQVQCRTLCWRGMWPYASSWTHWRPLGVGVEAGGTWWACPTLELPQVAMRV